MPQGRGEGVESIIEVCPWGSGGIYKSQGRGGGGEGGGVLRYNISLSSVICRGVWLYNRIAQ